MEIKMLIDGKLVGSKSGNTIEAINPATEEMLGTAPLGEEADVNKAVESASKAFKEWSQQSIEKRGHVLRGIARAIRERSDEIAKIEAADSGNPLARVRHDIEKSAQVLEYYAGLGYEMTGRTVPATLEHLHMTVREPYGVCARIVPFNHPFLFIAARIAAPLMAGNTVVVKPSDQAPLSSGIFSEILSETVPQGVVNIVTGDGKTGDLLVRHPKVPRIAFTGSVATGLRIQKSAAESGRIKHISLELGGKNPMILFPDADLEKAVAGVIKGMGFSWQGQSCGSTSRFFVHDSIYDRTVEAVVAKLSKFKVGDPLAADTNMGPIISKAQYEKVVSYVESAQQEGATLAFGGKRPEGMDRGYWILPTVFSDVRPTMRIAREEIFGPVLSILKFTDEEEAVQLANDCDYGLTGSIWTTDVNRAIRLSKKIESGYIWVNETATHFDQLPFGGYKQSGLGREEGIEELLSYTQVKTIHLVQQL